MNAERLLAHYERIADAPDAIMRLRRFILDLSVRGKLVPQDPKDEPASELLKRIAAEKVRLMEAGEIRRDEIVADLNKSNPELAVPLNWAICNLQSVCRSITDGDHLPPPKSENGIPFLVIGNVRSQLIDFAGSRFVPTEYYEALDPIRRPRIGDLLYTLVGSYGIPVVVRDDRPFCVQRHIGILRPSKFIDVGFLARAMQSRLVFDQATACATGIAQKTVPLFGLRRLSIPLPPLTEQHRIVAKVDELMALCDRLEAARAEREATRDRLAAASLARLNTPDPDSTIFADHARFALDAVPVITTRPDQIKRLRHTILNLAVRGKLAPQDPKDEPASELLKRIAVERIELVERRLIRREDPLDPIQPTALPFGIPSRWLWARIGEAVLLTQYGTSQKSSPSEKGVAVLTMGNIQDGVVVWNNEKTIPETSEDLPALYLCKFDILYNRTNSAELVGKTGIYLGEDNVRTFASYLIRLRPSLKWTDPRYLNIAMNAPEFRETQIVPLIKKQTGQANVNGTALKNMLIPLPPLAEQHRIVAKVDELMALCDRLEASLATGDDTRRRLLRALLDEALTPDSDVMPAETARIAAHG
jgi:type I restriction enzyme S subunit